MGIRSQGRCCGRNIVFDVVTGGGGEPPAPGILRLVFDDFANSGVTDPTDVAEWNSVYGWSFDSVAVTDTATVELTGTNFGNETIVAYQFQFNTGILQIVDEGGFIATIGEYAFDSSGIISVDFPALTTVPEWCFRLATSLTTVDMPSVTVISDYGFWAATSLSTYTFGNVTSIGTIAFLLCAITSADFPYATTVGEGAFLECTQLTTANLPILQNAGMGIAVFERCYAIASYTDVNIPLITQLPLRTFNECTGLVDFVSNTITSIGDDCFNSCTSLTTATFPNVTIVGWRAFLLCSSLSNYDFSSTTTIGNGAFSNTAITTCDFPAAINVALQAFTANTLLTTVDLPLCTNIGTECFENSTAITSINLPACTDMGAGAGNCFENIIGNTINATFNTALQMPLDPSIDYLNTNNTLSITWV